MPSGVPGSSGYSKHLPGDVEAAVETAIQGKGWEKIAKAFGCPFGSLHRILAINPPLKQLLDQARKAGQEVRADQVNSLVEDNQELPEDQRLPADLVRIKAECMKWYLGVMQPHRFGQRQTIAVERVDVAGALQEARQRAALPITARLITPGLERTDERSEDSERMERESANTDGLSLPYNGDESTSPLLVENGATLLPHGGEEDTRTALSYVALFE